VGKQAQIILATKQMYMQGSHLVCTISHKSVSMTTLKYSFTDVPRIVRDDMGEIPHRLSYAQYQSKPLISIAVEVVDESSLVMT